MKPAGWVDTVQWILPFAASGATWVVRGRRAEARAAAQDTAATGKTTAEAADVISTAAARTVDMLADQLDKLAETVTQQGEEIAALREQRSRDVDRIGRLTKYAQDMGVYVRSLGALFFELTGQAPPQAPAPPPGLVPDPDADDDVTVHPITTDAVGGTTWTAPTPPTPRPGS